MTKDEKAAHYIELANRHGAESVIRFLVEVIEGASTQRVQRVNHRKEPK